MRRTVMAIAVGVACIGLCAKAFASDQDERLWKWYYIAPGILGDTVLRAGRADVSISERAISIRFADDKIPEEQAVFRGGRTKNDTVQGTVTGLFPSGPEQMSGRYRQTKAAKNCILQEIVLRSGIADGSVLTVAHAKGSCTVTE